MTNLQYAKLAFIYSSKFEYNRLIITFLQGYEAVSNIETNYNLSQTGLRILIEMLEANINRIFFFYFNMYT